MHSFIKVHDIKLYKYTIPESLQYHFTKIILINTHLKNKIVIVISPLYEKTLNHTRIIYVFGRNCVL